ncbi:MAG: SDR family oxidoreductase [Bacteroidota bacterium]|jgi:NAD(P)-dependent dehydrogenase (short-subunit alcohol dehydrogenase family)|nr:SDR family oxidoreductase [Bacteroidota bacterium]
MSDKLDKIPAQSQDQQPGKESEMSPKPEYIRQDYKGAEKLKDKVAVITGGDSGIGRAVSVHFAREGCDIAIVYLNEDRDAEETKELVEAEGAKCILIKGDLGDEEFCRESIQKTVKEFGRLDILVNNAAEQHPQSDFSDVTHEQVVKTFETNIFAYFNLAHEALDHLPKDGVIINTTSVTAYRGSEHLVDYASTKGAIVSFTRALSKNLAEKGIRVNAVAPGPIWTPLIPATFDEEQVSEFGQDVPMKRPGQPSEVAPAYVYLASKDSSYVTGQVIHVNGGEVVGG